MKDDLEATWGRVLASRVRVSIRVEATLEAEALA